MTKYPAHWAILAVAACVAGCDSGSDLPPACAGAALTLDDCFVGDYFAECGGSGAARFGCTLDGDCHWFTGGCAPDGIVLSDCPAEDACCHTPPEGIWPYEEGPLAWPHDPRPAIPTSEMWQPLQGHGPQAWDRTRARVLDVALDPSIAHVPLEVACTGADPHPWDANPCGGRPSTVVEPEVTFSGVDTAVVFVDAITEGVHVGWWLRVEVVPMRDGTRRASACTYPFADVPGCPGDDEVDCATSGTVTLSRFAPAATDVAGTIDATFATGLHIQARF